MTPGAAPRAPASGDRCRGARRGRDRIIRHRADDTRPAPRGVRRDAGSASRRAARAPAKSAAPSGRRGCGAVLFIPARTGNTKWLRVASGPTRSRCRGLEGCEPGGSLLPRGGLPVGDTLRVHGVRRRPGSGSERVYLKSFELRFVGGFAEHCPSPTGRCAMTKRKAPSRTRIADGSSPRGRGTPGPRLDLPAVERFIPARAGNTSQGHAQARGAAGRVTPGATPRGARVRGPVPGCDSKAGPDHPARDGCRTRCASRGQPQGRFRRIASSCSCPCQVKAPGGRRGCAAAVHPRAGGEHDMRRINSGRFIPRGAGNTGRRPGD